MYQYYESRTKFGRKALFVRLLLALVFLTTLGFAGGVLYLLLFLVPAEQRLVDFGVSQGTIDLLLDLLILAWVLFGFLATFLYAASSCGAAEACSAPSWSRVPAWRRAWCSS